MTETAGNSPSWPMTAGNDAATSAAQTASTPGRRQSPQNEDESGTATTAAALMADQASLAATAILKGRCWHQRKCGCYSRYRTYSWLTLDALALAGWTFTAPEGGTHD